MKKSVRRDILLIVGVSQREIKDENGVTYQVSYCYQVMDMLHSETHQFEPMVAKDVGYSRIKLAVLLEFLQDVLPEMILDDDEIYVHYASADDRLKEIWDKHRRGVQKFTKKEVGYNVDYWKQIIALCNKYNVTLYINGKDSVLTALNKGQSKYIEKKTGERVNGK